MHPSIQEAVAVAKQAAADNSVVVLANIARQCLVAGLLDEELVQVAPVCSATGHAVRPGRRLPGPVRRRVNGFQFWLQRLFKRERRRPPRC